MRDRVYIETTIPSFYYEVRTEPDMVARRAWTRRWWDGRRPDYDLQTSVAVLDELEGGSYSKKRQCLNLLDGVSLLSIEPDVIGRCARCAEAW